MSDTEDSGTWSDYGSPSELSPEASEAEEAGSDYEGEQELSGREADAILNRMYAQKRHRTPLEAAVGVVLNELFDGYQTDSDDDDYIPE